MVVSANSTYCVTSAHLWKYGRRLTRFFAISVLPISYSLVRNAHLRNLLRQPALSLLRRLHFTSSALHHKLITSSKSDSSGFFAPPLLSACILCYGHCILLPPFLSRLALYRMPHCWGPIALLLLHVLPFQLPCLS